MPAVSVKELAEKLGGSFTGDGALMVEKLVHPKAAANATDLVVAFDKNLHTQIIDSPAASIVLAEGQQEIAKKFRAAIFFKRPRYALAALTEMFATAPAATPGVHPSAVVDATATLGKNVQIGPQCWVGPRAVIGDGTQLIAQASVGADARVGKDCIIYSGARIADRVIIGDRVILNFNAVIGSEGFSFVTPEASNAELAKEDSGSVVQTANTAFARIYSLGAVVLGDDVEIGANTTIDRGTLTNTSIGRGTKIDNQVQIGHNVVIGEDCILCGCVGVAGSSEVGNRVMLAARSGVADHVKVGDDAVLMAASQLAGNLPAKNIYMGFPAMPRDRFMEQIMHAARLKNNMKRLDTIELKVNELEKNSKSG